MLRELILALFSLLGLAAIFAVMIFLLLWTLGYNPYDDDNDI